ncbi:unnamed protein product [Amoebophrya sp. A25]|nr:unnamed protein product [Amoebophrya sp. A25]|eukprot:GSA25T00025554001.1
MLKEIARIQKRWLRTQPDHQKMTEYTRTLMDPDLFPPVPDKLLAEASGGAPAGEGPWLQARAGVAEALGRLGVSRVLPSSSAESGEDLGDLMQPDETSAGHEEVDEDGDHAGGEAHENALSTPSEDQKTHTILTSLTPGDAKALTGVADAMTDLLGKEAVAINTQNKALRKLEEAHVTMRKYRKKYAPTVGDLIAQDTPAISSRLTWHRANINPAIDAVKSGGKRVKREHSLPTTATTVTSSIINTIPWAGTVFSEASSTASASFAKSAKVKSSVEAAKKVKSPAGAANNVARPMPAVDKPTYVGVASPRLWGRAIPRAKQLKRIPTQEELAEVRRMVDEVFSRLGRPVHNKLDAKTEGRASVVDAKPNEAGKKELLLRTRANLEEQFSELRKIDEDLGVISSAPSLGQDAEGGPQEPERVSSNWRLFLTENEEIDSSIRAEVPLSSLADGISVLELGHRNPRRAHVLLRYNDSESARSPRQVDGWMSWKTRGQLPLLLTEEQAQNLLGDSGQEIVPPVPRVTSSSADPAHEIAPPVPVGRVASTSSATGIAKSSSTTSPSSTENIVKDTVAAQSLDGPPLLVEARKPLFPFTDRPRPVAKVIAPPTKGVDERSEDASTSSGQGSSANAAFLDLHSGAQQRDQTMRSSPMRTKITSAFDAGFPFFNEGANRAESAAEEDGRALVVDENDVDKMDALHVNRVAAVHYWLTSNEQAWEKQNIGVPKLSLNPLKKLRHAAEGPRPSAAEKRFRERMWVNRLETVRDSALPAPPVKMDVPQSGLSKSMQFPKSPGDPLLGETFAAAEATARGLMGHILAGDEVTVVGADPGVGAELPPAASAASGWKKARVNRLIGLTRGAEEWFEVVFANGEKWGAPGGMLRHATSRDEDLSRSSVLHPLLPQDHSRSFRPRGDDDKFEVLNSVMEQREIDRAWREFLRAHRWIPAYGHQNSGDGTWHQEFESQLSPDPTRFVPSAQDEAFLATRAAQKGRGANNVDHRSHASHGAPQESIASTSSTPPEDEKKDADSGTMNVESLFDRYFSEKSKSSAGKTAETRPTTEMQLQSVSYRVPRVGSLAPIPRRPLPLSGDVTAFIPVKGRAASNEKKFLSFLSITTTENSSSSSSSSTSKWTSFSAEQEYQPRKRFSSSRKRNERRFLDSGRYPDCEGSAGAQHHPTTLLGPRRKRIRHDRFSSFEDFLDVPWDVGDKATEFMPFRAAIADTSDHMAQGAIGSDITDQVDDV